MLERLTVEIPEAKCELDHVDGWTLLIAGVAITWLGQLSFALGLLGGVLLGSLKYERFFCKYACPLGAVIGILGKFGLTKIVRSGGPIHESSK